MYIEIKDVKKDYLSRKKYTALRGIDLKIEKGEFIGIMGPSGAGKTTLLNILSTIDNPTSGSVMIEGHEITSMKENDKANYRGKYLGFVFQDFNLINNMTVKENILLPLMIKRGSDYSGIGQLSKNLGIESLLEKYPYELSGGEKQRVAVARATITTPKLLLADEPTGNLDSKSASSFLGLMKEMIKYNNLTTVMVSHDPYVASFTDKVFILKDGQIFTEINSDGNRKDFHDRLIKSLSLLGGE